MPDTPQAIAEKGERIYREKYQPEFEQKYIDKFVAIDTKTEKAFVADSPAEAILAAQKAEGGGGPFHVIKVGSLGVYRVGYSASGSAHDWIFGR
jgi:hypothetical protein